MFVVRNNLALTLAEQEKFDAALQEIGMAQEQNRDPVLDSELSDTELSIRRMHMSEE